jgi:hypothetical protein
VPPLSVVGLTLESGALQEALGALLLFVTNVVAIIATGIVVMSIYGVNRLSTVASESAGVPVRATLRRPISIVAVMLVIIGIPLTLRTVDVSIDWVIEGTVRSVAVEWADDAGWEVLGQVVRGGERELRVAGPMPLPYTAVLK